MIGFSSEKIAPSESSNKIKVIGFTLLLLLALTPFIILSLYNQPVLGDDYLETSRVHQYGFWGVQKFYYLYWMGRYFSNILISLNPLIFNATWAYKLNIIIILPLFVLVTYWVSGKIFSQLNKPGKVILTSIFISTFLLFMPDVGQGLYWQSGCYTTLTPNILTFILFGVIINYNNSNTKNSFLALACLLVIAIVGCYEVHMIYIDLVLSLFVFLSFLKKHNLVLPLILIGVCVISSIFEITAPGNQVRALTLHYSNTRDLVFSLRHSLSFVLIPTYVYPLGLLVEWMLQSLLIGVLLFELPVKQLFTDKTEAPIFLMPLWLSLLVCISIPFLGPFLCFWAQGTAPEQRTLNGVYFYFMIGIIYFFFSLILFIKKRLPNFKIPVYFKVLLVFLLLFLLNFHSSFIKKNNITLAYSDIFSGTAAAFNRESNERNAFLLNYKGDSCTVDPIKDIPHSIFFIELPCDIKKITSSDMERWKLWLDQLNTPYREYYHKKYIGLKGQ